MYYVYRACHHRAEISCSPGKAPYEYGDAKGWMLCILSGLNRRRPAQRPTEQYASCWLRVIFKTPLGHYSCILQVSIAPAPAPTADCGH